MAKTSKHYRLSERTLEALKILKGAFPKWSETELVEAAIQEMASQAEAQSSNRRTISSLRGWLEYRIAQLQKSSNSELEKCIELGESGSLSTEDADKLAEHQRWLRALDFTINELENFLWSIQEMEGSDCSEHLPF